MIYKPRQESPIILQDIDLKDISAYINWTSFFSAWRIPGKYEGIEQVCTCPSCELSFLEKTEAGKREQAKEALRLFRDAQELLSDIIEGKMLCSNAIGWTIKAKSENEGIIFYPHGENNGIYLPMLRQQKPKESDYFLSLADFISPVEDYIGIFAVSISGSDELKNRYESENDIYKSILAQTVADRLAEATAEWFHKQVRVKYWGYAVDENVSIKDLFKSRYQGIRPAVGYPSLPDQSIIFTLNKILDIGQIGVSLTENGAMYPNASICGLMLAHPKSRYFVIDHIDNDQLKDYANRKGISVEETKKWLTGCL